ncbi:hypothetical protein J2W42_006427 [Rhizobium tibeticum]|uniref:hypothetical protein n=1 Tax=Rhizobium tibeticum TaxID=501024 RepID=UPI00278470B4|nr:hypothetical protein [Rhizobium tibeticum]MDP9813553.1 hypothetical protein [Rhizobium tibeticum]
MEFFTTNFANDLYDASNKASFQGQLSSSYDAALSAEVKALADYVGFIYSKQPGVSIDAAKAIVDAISSGNFQLTDLQGSAQSKTGPVAGSAVQDPDPTVIVNGVSISIKEMLGGLDTETWKDAGKNGQYHTREFYTSTHEPDGYHADWANPPKPNEAPTATEIHVTATETQSTYNASHLLSNGNVEDHKVVNLLEGASDPDGDTLMTGGYHFFDKDHNEITQPSYISIVDGNLVIDQNHRDLDGLKAGDHLGLSVTYDINDGNGHTISNAAYIDIEGTADISQETGSGHVEQTHLRSDSTTGGGNINGHVLTPTFAEQQDGGFDFTVTSAKLTATEGGLTGNEKVTVSDGSTIEFASGGAMNLDGTTTTDSRTLLDSALNDNNVDYNVGFNGQADATDSVKVAIDYTYDYWHWA